MLSDGYSDANEIFASYDETCAGDDNFFPVDDENAAICPHAEGGFARCATRSTEAPWASTYANERPRTLRWLLTTACQVGRSTVS